ncbi:MAG: alpha/beta fold hydrolase, partial [Gammaproteobacteria bacterium]|nr:alpha/beta fold hydrolase [Gammaproteobacteria bacterium]
MIALRTRSRTQAWLAGTALVLLAGIGHGAARSAPGDAAGLTVGGMGLRRCRTVAAYCGDLTRPLDPSGAWPGRIHVHFEWYPHTGPGPVRTTLVATEGGPGYPATLSRRYYLGLFGPLRANHDVLLMDNRGTGRSGALVCPRLQVAPRWTVAGIAACGRDLGPRAAFYGTAFATDDLAAILSALGIHRIELYGDSYGTYFEQIFALRHPAFLRSIVLDGAYPLDGPHDAWYPNYAPAMRAKFDRACRRYPACARLPGDSIDHILPALRALRHAPFAARAMDANGRVRHFTADASRLAIVMFAGAPALASVRETDAAARAFVAGDRAPLLRLMAETLSGVDSRDPTDDPTKWSAGLAAAVLCHDPPQIFPMSSPPAERLRERRLAIERFERRDPDAYAPFTFAEFRAMPLDYSFIDECVGWPVAPAAAPAGRVVPAGARYPDVPALVISGDLDDMTTVADGAAVAHEFPRGRQVVIANGFHVNALPGARSGCAEALVRRFLASGNPGDTACAATAPALRLVSRFVRRARSLTPARASPGNRASPADLRIARAAVMAVGDVVVRVGENTTGHGPGLRGGRFTVAPGGHGARLARVRWTRDVAVTGWV